MNVLPDLKRPERSQLWESVLETLRDAIITGDLAPGTHLLEVELAEKLGVSRWPVRQAITRLTEEHLVVSAPRRGAVVARLSPDDVREIFEIRRILETTAARKATKRVEPQHIDQLRALLAQMVALVKIGDFARFSHVDMQFHRTWFVIGGSKRLLEMWQLICPAAQVLFVRGAEQDPDLAHGVYDRHNPLIEALAKRDADAVEKAIIAHLAQAEANALCTVQAAASEATCEEA